jgi:hypothetical protein
MKSQAALPLLAAVLIFSCSLLAELRRPPRAPPEEAANVEFSLYTPKSAVNMDAVLLRAASMALEDYFPEPGNEASSCYDRMSSYDVMVWMAEGASPDSGCPWPDAGYRLPDGGYVEFGLMTGITCETLYGTPGLVYVDISLKPGACDDADGGGEIILDLGGIYAIDVKRWRIAAAHR